MESLAGGSAPLSLVRRIDDALRGAGGDAADPVAQLRAAEACLKDALARGSVREAALHLLAADALMTSACGVAVQAGSTSVEALAGMAADRLARLLDPETQP